MNSKKLIFTVLLLSFYSDFALLGQPGTLDLSFNPATSLDWSIWTTAIQSDGKILIGGEFMSANGVAEINIDRLNPDGSHDTTFFPGAGAEGIAPIVVSTAIQSDGKILIGGEFEMYNGVQRTGIVRVYSNGAIDSSFIPPIGYYVYSVKIQNDGKLVIAVDGPPGILRLNNDGSMDTTFNPGTGGSGITHVEIQNDGKILLAGGFSTYNGILRRGIARINEDGSLDTTFITGSGANYAVFCVSIQTDGKILIGGDFTTYNGISANHIARLNVDGTMDSFFATGTGANNYIVTTTLQSDGKIIIGGVFTAYSGTPISRIARLNTDGILDTVFDPGVGPNDGVYTSAIQTDGKIIIGGFFDTYDGITRKYAARVNTLTTGIEEMSNYKLFAFPNPTDGIINIVFETIMKNVSVKVSTILGQYVAAYLFEQTNSVKFDIQGNPGIYFVELRTDENQISRVKVVKN